MSDTPDPRLKNPCPVCHAIPGERCIVTDLKTGKVGHIHINGVHEGRA